LTSWDDALLAVLKEPAAGAKAALAERVLAEANNFDLSVPPSAEPPNTPGRPAEPELIDPAKVPRRRLGSEAGRAALLHALAHIELNAVDLAADMAVRFAGQVPDDNRATFVRDWIQVAGEEGLHFRLLGERLAAYQTQYGDHPAHNGLWDAARKTSGDLLGRLAIAPMILEARGLDVTPGLIEKLQQVGDNASAKVLKRIYDDEIGHVRTGVRWFIKLAKAAGYDPEQAFHDLVERYFPGGPKPPFNVWARDRAELPYDWYAAGMPQ